MSDLTFRMVAAVSCIALLVTACAPMTRQEESAQDPIAHLQQVQFADLPGWEADSLQEAWPAFLVSCRVLKKKEQWKPVCTRASEVPGDDREKIRNFFETFMRPYQAVNQDGSKTGLATGYYEPLLRGSRKQTQNYSVPLYGVPDDLLTIDMAGLYPELKNKRVRGRLEGKRVVPYYTREEIEQSNKLAGKELLWVDNVIDAFFLQIQGSGRVHLVEENEMVRVAYANQNGHPYYAIGRYLVSLGELTREQVSAQSIREWLEKHPQRIREVLYSNPGYVFFTEEKHGSDQQGPRGALGVPLTPERSIAVDPQYIPLGVPVFINMQKLDYEGEIRRLVMAQDTGGAIKGRIRMDYFCGFGDEAGEQAGLMRQAVRMWVLLPKQ